MSHAFDARFIRHPAFSLFESGLRARVEARERFPVPSELRAFSPGIPSATAPWLPAALGAEPSLKLD